MIEMKKIWVFYMLVIVFAGCHKEKELLTGDVMGKITIYNQDLTASSDNSGVEVSLYSNSSLLETKVTDEQGMYRFENISYGKYSIDLQRNNYVKPSANYYFNHIGGYSPSIFDGSLYQIPDYILTIDSVRAQPSEARLLVYFKTNGSVEIPPYYTLIGYCGNDQTVSKDNYSFILVGAMLDRSFPDYYQKADAVMFNIYRDGALHMIELIPSNLIFIRFHLLTRGQSSYGTLNRIALGKPSNVMSFVWQ